MPRKAFGSQGLKLQRGCPSQAASPSEAPRGNVPSQPRLRGEGRLQPWESSSSCATHVFDAKRRWNSIYFNELCSEILVYLNLKIKGEVINRRRLLACMD